MKKLVDFIEQKPTLVILGLLLFHIMAAFLMTWVASSSYLTALHYGQGIWKFSGDSLIYHREALTLIEILNVGDWASWWSSFPGHFHVKWVGLLYWLYGEGAPFLFELVNSVTWVTSVVLVYLAARTLFNNTLIAGLAVLFLFFPSVILSSTQLLREPFYILGLCFIVFGWVSIFQESSTWKGVFSIVIGFIIVSVVRSYLLPILFWVFAIATLILIFRRKFARYPALLMLLSISLITFGVDFSKVPPIEGGGFSAASTRGVEDSVIVKANGDVIDENEGEVKGKLKSSIIDEKTGEINRDGKKFVYDKDGNIIGYVIPIILKNNGEIAAVFVRTDSEGSEIHGKGKSLKDRANKEKNNVFNRVAWRLDAMRFGFRRINVNAGSNIDGHIRYRNIWDALTYLPRAIQISFLSPFPHHWVSSGRETGKVGRLISGFETIVLYFIFIGFLYALFKKIRTIEPLLPVLILSGIVIVLLGYAVPNVGAIYRMRQGLLIPFFIVGVYGLYLMFEQLKLKLSEND